MARKNHEDTLAYYKAYNAKRRQQREKQARQLAIEAGETHYHTGKPCKHGHIAYRRVKDRACMECDRIERKNKPATPEQKRESYIRNRDKILAQKREYRQANKGRIRALNSLRKQYIKQRTPSWVDNEVLFLIREIYDLAAIRTVQTGFAWHVDHVIPLQGKLVSGLHVPENLQVIPAVVNIQKKNKYEVAYGY